MRDDAVIPMPSSPASFSLVTRLASFTAAAAVLVVTACVAGCSSDAEKPTGGGGTSGGEDVDSGAGSGDAGTSGEGGASDKKKNAEQGCAKDEECESNVCFIGGNQTFCTVRCTTDNAATVCVAPFTGSCNKQGYCKRD